MDYQVNDKFERISKAALGQSNDAFIMNEFKITDVTNKSVKVLGILSSNKYFTKKINKQDFDSFIKKYRKI